VAASYDGTNTFLYIDGMLVDQMDYQSHIAMSFTTDFYVGQEGAANLTHATASEPQDERKFHGLIYDIEVMDGAIPAWSAKMFTQCPRKAISTASSYLKFEGAGTTVKGYGEGNAKLGKGDIVASAKSMTYVNVSYDDPTVWDSTTINGREMNGAKSEVVGTFTITARTACGKKRLHGGDSFNVTMVPSNGDASLSASVSVKDTNDGLYHVRYEGNCTTYDTKVFLGTQQVDAFQTTIEPSTTSAPDTYIVDFAPTCFGVPNVFTIQAMDAHGCKKTDNTDVFQVNVTGPNDVSATVTPMGNGLYSVYFVPEQVGKYFVDVRIGGVLIRDGSFCFDVCAGGAAAFTGGKSAIVVAEGTGQAAMDLSGSALTMSAYVKGSEAVNETGYLLFKGSEAELANGNYTKGYSLYVKDGFLNAVVYVGLGVHRSVSAAFAAEDWVHVAAVYDGASFKIYLDGIERASEAFSEPKDANPNPYEHPLVIGHGFEGKITQLKLANTAMTADDISESMGCPGFSSDVAAYFSFGEKSTATKATGFGSACKPASASSMAGTCMSGVLSGTGVSFSEDDTPYPASQKPSSYYSGLDWISKNGASSSLTHVAGGDVIISMVAKDVCGYNFIPENDDVKLELVATPYEVNYEGAVSLDACATYPLITTGTAIAEASTRTTTATCPGAATGSDVVASHGNAFEATGKNLTQAGLYYVQIEENPRQTNIARSFFLPSTVTLNVIPASPAQIVIVRRPSAEPIQGVPYAVVLTLMDAYFNKVTDAHTIDAMFVPSIGSDEKVGTVVSHGSGTYVATFLFDSPDVSYFNAFSLTGGSVTDEASISVTVSHGYWSKIYTYEDNVGMPKSVRRQGHSSMVSGEDLVIWGGASSDKTYLSDTQILRGANVMAKGDTFFFVKHVNVSVAAAVGNDVTIEVIVNTKELVDAARMHPMCYDVLFTAPQNGERLNYYMDPTPGCYSESTRFFVRLPKSVVSAAGLKVVDMSYGNGYATGFNQYHGLAGVTDIFDDFEDAAKASMWSSDDGCGSPGTPLKMSYNKASPAAYRGGHVLEMSGTGKIAWTGTNFSSSPGFKMSGWIWDNGACASSHYMSPDFTDCGATTTQGKPLLPHDNVGMARDARSTALGLYTLSDNAAYAMASPWQSTTHSREAGWHRLEVTSGTASGMVAQVDGVTVKETSTSVDFYSLSLTAGLGVDTLSHAGLSDGIAYWDDVSVMAYDDSIGVSAGALGDDVAALNVISQRVWETLSTTASPPPRYEHSTCHPKHIGNRHTNDVTSDYMVIFGGERSSYLYNDVWALSTKSVGGVRTATWEFLPHLSKEVPSPRMGHSAVVYESDAVVNAQGKNELPAGSKMIVYGGRDHTGNLGDVWSYDLQSRIWTKLAASTPLGARFGHSAAMFGSTMYVMGGYTSTGFSGEFFKADIACKMPSYTGTYVSATAKGCNVTVTDITTGCMNAAGPSSVSLTPRFAQGAIADSTSVYFTGGTDFSSEPGSFGQVYRFKVATCEWDTVIVNGEEARSEMSLGAFGTGIYVQGGTSPDGSFASNVQYMPLSD